MSADHEQTAKLRELHDAYVWAVNAAVARGRDDLVAELADEYTTEALRMMAEQASPGCDRPDCLHAPRPQTTPRRRGGWLRRFALRRRFQSTRR
jgi:hypothetical protein